MGFDTGSPYYQSSADGGGIGGTDCINITFTPESDDSSWLGASEHNGATKAFAKVKEGLNEESLHEKAVAWQKIASVHETYDTDLTAAAKAIFEKPGVWEGDDADAALKIFNGTLASSSSLKSYTANMSTNVSAIHSAVVEAKGVSSHGGSSGFAGTGLGGGGGDGSKDTAAYMKMAEAIDGGRQKMPTEIQYQNKPSGSALDLRAGQHQGGPGGPGSTGAAVGGPSSAPHVKGPSTTGVKSPGDLPHPTTVHGPGSDPGSHPGGVDPITTPGYPVGSPGPGGTGPGSYPTPTLTGGSTLAGYDPGSAGGFASGGGAGGFGAGAGSVGMGGGGLAGGAGGLSGTGIGSAGAGLSSAGFGAGSGEGVGAGSTGGTASESAAGAAGAGRGVAGTMMPMRGGGAGGGSDEDRERSTWLEEDDDVWGSADEVPPSTIS